MAKKTGEKKKKGGGGLPNQKSKTDAGTGDCDAERNRKLMPYQVILSTLNAIHRPGKHSDSCGEIISNQLLADVGKRALEVAEQAREKKKQKKEQKLKKEEEEEEQSSEEEEEVGGRELPSVNSDKTLAGIAAKVKGIDFLCSKKLILCTI